MFRALNISDGECSNSDQEDANKLNLTVFWKMLFTLKIEVGKVLFWEVFLKN